MEIETYKKEIRRAIRYRVFDLRDRGIKTSKGEEISLAAIGRTLDPPVTREAVFQVAKGLADTQRIRDAIERELGQPYWIKRKVA